MTYGTLIDVNGGKLNVYTEGSGKLTIVFMAGSGVSAPGLEYKPLFSKLSDEYRIAVVEKAGYGLSSAAKTPRTVENMVEESRAALKGAGIEPPYVLAPHSYSGLEAVWWANNYTDEVKAIIGVDMIVKDMALAQAKELPDEKKKVMLEKQHKLLAKIAKQGFLSKLVKNKTENVSGLMTSDYLNAEEKALYRELFYKNLLNPEINEEVMLATPNAQRVAALGKLKVPAYLYISNMNSPVKSITWQQAGINFVTENGCKYTLSDKGHMMYTKIPDEMAKNYKEFLAGLSY